MHPGDHSQITPARRHRFKAWLIGLAFIVLALGPPTAREVPHEIGRWYYAAAVIAEDAGEWQLAVERLEEAIRWGGLRPEYAILRAKLYWHLGDRQSALTELDRAVQAATPEKLISVYMQRAELHLKMHERAAAVQDWQQIYDLVQGGHVPTTIPAHVVYNALAYMRALANQDLEQALEKVNLALAQEADNAAYLDTRGFIYYRLGKYSKALEDLDRAVELARQQWQSNRRRLINLKRQYIDVRPIDELLQENDRNYAVILYHRALVQDLFDADKAEQDFAEIRRLGFPVSADLF
jgi:tetratricopeptide (TPR) repeat protein